MLSSIKSLLATDFMPHGYCLGWHSDVLWLHVLSDALISRAYLCIPILLVIVMRKRKDIPFDWLLPRLPPSSWRAVQPTRCPS
jgi:hypothetical protein